jgi:phenylpyruvate tautomerase
MVLLTRLPLASSIDYFAVMPYLSMQTNRDLPEKKQTELLGAASKIVASELGKPESVVMVSFAPAVHMTFAGEESPTAFLELRSIGVPDSKRNSLSSALTDLVARNCEIKPDRIFVVLVDVNARFWSLSGATIG